MNRQSPWLFETPTASYSEYETTLESEWEVQPRRRPASGTSRTPLRRTRLPSRPSLRRPRPPQRNLRQRLPQQRSRSLGGQANISPSSPASPSPVASDKGTKIATIDRFGFGSYLLSRHQFEQLQELTLLLIAHKDIGVQVKLTFIGHTDNAGGETPGNFHLAGRRAIEVETHIMRLFKERYPELNLVSSISGKGSREPIASNTTKDGQARNRRVEIFSNVPLPNQ